MKNFFLKLFLRFYRRSSRSQKRILSLGIKKLGIPNKSYYKNLKFHGEFWVRLSKNKNFKMVHYGGYIENETFWQGPFTTFENEVGKIWMELCKCSDIIFDIGANTGIYSLVAKKINPNAEVYAFEPSFHTFKKLARNNQINGFNITCEQIAVSNKNGDQVFYDLPNQHQTTASLSPDKMKNLKDYTGGILEYNVKSQKLANYIENNNIGNIDLIKIDIEMHEPEAIEGLGKYLTEYKPILVIEVLSDKVAHELNNLIEMKDFKLFHLKFNNRAEELKKFKLCEGSLSSWEWNYLLFHKDLEDKVKKNTTIYK